MAVDDHWIYQGRQEHGWFGDGTAPPNDNPDKTADNRSGGLFATTNIGERIDYAAHGVIGHLSRPARQHVAAAFDSGAL
jgi:hypothetical protein